MSNTSEIAPVDAILFSANPAIVAVDDAMRHLAHHEELYWEVGFSISIVKNAFCFPIYGFIHICGGQVEYRVRIRDIIPFSREHYEDKALAERVKPEPWLREWREDYNSIRSYPWKHALVMNEIVPFSYDTYSFQKYDGTKIQWPPQGYIRVLPPGDAQQTGHQGLRHLGTRQSGARQSTTKENAHAKPAPS